MRVLFLNPTGFAGGAERSLIDLMASIRAHPREIEMGLLAGGDGPLVAEAEALGIHATILPLGDRVQRVGDSSLLNGERGALAMVAARAALGAADAARYVLQLRAAIDALRPTVVHSNGIKMHLLAAAARPRVPIVWHIRDFLSERPMVSRALRFVEARVDAAIAISQAVAADACSLLPKLPVTVVHDGIDTELFSPAGPAADIDGLAGLTAAPPDAVRVGLVATYARWKGHDIFLRATRLAISRLPPRSARFYVVGGPIYETAASQYDRTELAALVRGLGLTDSVAFVPFQMQVQQVYRALDVVVHASSRREPFGRTIAEGMASGNAVIASNDGGAAELFVDGIEARGVRPGDEAALADAMVELILDGERRARFGAQARTTAVRRFSRARLAGQILGVYAAGGRPLPDRASSL